MDTVIELHHSGSEFRVLRDCNGTTLCFGGWAFGRVPLGLAYPKQFIRAAEMSLEDQHVHSFGFNINPFRPWKGAFKAKDSEWIELRASFSPDGGQPRASDYQVLHFGLSLFSPGMESGQGQLPRYVIALRRTEVEQIIDKIDSFNTV